MRKHKPKTCSRCGQRGHNTRTCPQPAPPKVDRPKRGRGRPKGSKDSAAKVLSRIEAKYPGLLADMQRMGDSICARRHGVTRQYVNLIRKQHNITNEKGASMPGCYVLLPLTDDDGVNQSLRVLPLTTAEDIQRAMALLHDAGHVTATIWRGDYHDPTAVGSLSTEEG